MAFVSPREGSPISFGSASSGYSSISGGSAQAVKAKTKVFFVERKGTEKTFFGLFTKQVTRLHLARLDSKGKVVLVDKVGIKAVKANTGFFGHLFGSKQVSLGNKAFSATVDAKSLSSFFKRADASSTRSAKELAKARHIDVTCDVEKIARVYLNSHLLQQGQALVKERVNVRKGVVNSLHRRVEEAAHSHTGAQLAHRRGLATSEQLQALEQEYEALYQQVQLEKGAKRPFDDAQLKEIDEELQQVYGVSSALGDEAELNKKLQGAGWKREFEWIRNPEAVSV